MGYYTSQGAIAELRGGSFKDSFVSGFVSSGFSIGNKGYGNAMSRTAIMAVVGGTVSKLGGGKFANGAITASFVHMFNAEGVMDMIADRVAFGTRDDAWHQENSAMLVDSLETVSSVYVAGKIVRSILGPIKHWIRPFGNSYSKAGGFKTMGMRWGTNAHYRSELPNSYFRGLNESLRGMKLPGSSWRTQDSGHFHIIKR